MRLNNFLSALFVPVLDLVAPPRGTEAIVRGLTEEKLRTIALEKPATYAAAVHTILPYRHPSVKALIYELKYRRNARALELAARLLGEELMGAFEESIGMPLLIPVPMHRERLRTRGYNQAELLCATLMGNTAAGRMPLDYAPRALERTRMGLPQQKLPRKKRLTNVRGAMQADQAAVHGRICIVLDDVTTTGATLMECRRALLDAEARTVILCSLSG
jgi:ComF family protein